MTPEDILRHPARVLTQDQREAYFRDGYLVVERLIPEDVVDEVATRPCLDALAAPLSHALTGFFSFSFRHRRCPVARPL